MSQQPGKASAGVPGGRAPSGATGSGVSTDDADDRPAADPGDAPARHVAGQPAGTASPVPSPGDRPGTSVPAVSAAQGASPQDGIHQGEKAPDSDASVASPAADVALAAPGHPDGEVDTRTQ